MILGPVFHVELLTTSRRRRYYLARVVYGLILLALVGWTYQQMQESRRARRDEVAGIAFLAETASAIFSTFITTQVVAVLCLTPAMVAGTVADEKQRKTLHYLLASELTGLEIVGGKLAARMLQLVILIAVGLPIMSILSLFGGLDPEVILVAFLGTLTTAFCLACLSILVSTVSRRARDAIVVVYILEAIWLVGPSIARAMTGTSSSALDWVEWLVKPIVSLDPFQLAHLTNPSPELPGRLAWMAGWQVTLGLGFLAIAVWRLRPSFGGTERGRAPMPTILPRLFRRREIGSDPMLWKEFHVARSGLVIRLFGLLLAVFAAVFLGDALLDHGRASFAEVAKYGYGDGIEVVHRARDQLQEFVATTAAGAYLLWMIGIATASASGISSEREDDTWISLLGTAITGEEILRAKALGALWRWRVVGLLAVGLWTFGLIAGAIHPIAYVMTLADFTAFSAFALALGSYVSLRAKSTTRAMVVTISVLFVLNIGYLMCLFPIAQAADPLWMAPCTPYVMGIVPAPYSRIQYLFGTYPLNQQIKLDMVAARVLTCLVSFVGYGVAAMVLGGFAWNGFEAAADRPRRPPGFSPALAESLDSSASDSTEP
jgi:ABC-type transport system involved in multi-copper enzyme maturation permease subunit